jgi:hypothetical protein
MAANKITIVNKSESRLLFCNFNAGDNKIPFDTAWIDPNGTGELRTGTFSSLGIGIQAQEGGRWIDGDPKDRPFARPGQTLTFINTRQYS